MKKDVIHIHNRLLFSFKKDRNSAICKDMVIPRGHYAKWDKLDRERQILSDITDVCTL